MLLIHEELARARARDLREEARAQAVVSLEAAEPVKGSAAFVFLH